MCGIFGQIEFGSSRVDAGALPAMGDVMGRRGPDGAGIFIQNGMAFGHRRLKIIDLTDAAQQPMFDAALGLGIVYNGAIYNYPELRKTLQEMGYSFFSTGDTEVLIKAYHAWGEDFVERLNGMFAFAIWERDSGKVVLARDRLGIKPLYFADTASGFRFASTLPAILAGGEHARDPVHARVAIGVAHALVQRADQVVVLVARLVVAQDLVLQRLGQHGGRDLALAAEQRRRGLEQRQRAPCRGRFLGARNRRRDLLIVGERPFDKDAAIDRRDTLQYIGHQPRSNMRCRSRSVTWRSCSDCSQRAAWR